MQRKAAILQSNYIPWKGYFDLVHDVDVFVFYDTVQYTKNDWRNRNRIKTSAGSQWLTVPVGTSLRRRICDVEMTDSAWQKKHWKTIIQCYSKAPYFSRYQDFFESVYLRRTWRNLSDLNQFLVKAISREFLGIGTEFKDSREYVTHGEKSERLIDIVKAVDARVYLSGPAAMTYLSEDAFTREGIVIQYKSYDGYPEYPQLYPPFDHFVSIVDLLFQVGDRAPDFIWGARKSTGC